MTNVNNAWKSDLLPYVTKSFDYTYSKLKNKIENWIGITHNPVMDIRMQSLAGYGELPIIAMGDTPAEANQSRGFGVTRSAVQRGHQVVIQRLAAKVDKLGECKRVGARCATDITQTIRKMQHRLFSDAFNANVLGGDGLPWASDSHWVASKGDENGVWTADRDKGTYSNLITDVLSGQSVCNAQRAGMKIPTPEGYETGYFEDENDLLLLVSVDLLDTAKRICGVTGSIQPEKDPDNANNAANPTYGMKYGVVYGFAPNQWALADSRGLKETAFMNFVEDPIVLEEKKDSELVAVFLPYFVAQIGFADARAIVFSNPA